MSIKSRNDFYIKIKLQEIYDNIAEGVKIRSKCQWYEENEKSTKHSLNLEEKHAEKSTIQRLITDKKDLVKYDDINNEIFSNFKYLFERIGQIDKVNHNTLLASVTLASVTIDQKVVCDNDFTDKELFDYLKGIPNNKFLIVDYFFHMNTYIYSSAVVYWFWIFGLCFRKRGLLYNKNITPPPIILKNSIKTFICNILGLFISCC